MSTHSWPAGRLLPFNFCIVSPGLKSEIPWELQYFWTSQPSLLSFKYEVPFSLSKTYQHTRKVTAYKKGQSAGHGSPSHTPNQCELGVTQFFLLKKFKRNCIFAIFLLVKSGPISSKWTSGKWIFMKWDRGCLSPCFDGEEYCHSRPKIWSES